MHGHCAAHRPVMRFFILIVYQGPCKKSNGWELSLSKGFHPDRHDIPISAKEAIQGRYRLHSAPTVHHFIDFEYSLNSRRLGLGWPGDSERMVKVENL